MQPEIERLAALAADYQFELVLIAVGLAVFAATYAYGRFREKKKVQAAFEAGLTHSAQAHQIELEQWAQGREQLIAKLEDSQRASAVVENARTEARNQLAEVRSDLDKTRADLSRVLSEAAADKARLEEARSGFEQREAMFRETSAALKKEFELLANRVFDSQEEKHKARLSSVLTPFKDQILDFRKRVDEVYHTDTKDRASLLAEIKNLQRSSDRINEEAENLTRALKGDKKLQGNWGELVLERVLEESGLRKDHEYFLQPAQRNAEGDLKRPDVIIRLPDNKDVVIDSKMSLVAYEQAIAAEDEAERGKSIRTHLLNLRAHVKKLSEQEYDRLEDIRSLDFVLLFIPIESAFTLAMEHDPRLFSEAFEQRIVVVSPTTLMMTLRIINNVWRYEKQNQNAQEIARRAGALYDKLRVLVDEMDTLGKQLGTAEKTYASVYAKLATGKGNLVRQVENFRELGAQVKKPMDPKKIENASAESPNSTGE